MQVDVRQQRGDHAALGRTGVRVPRDPFLQHACVEPLTDRTAEHAVSHPLVEETPQMPMVDAVEVVLDVDFEHPASLRVHHRLPQRLECVVGRPARPEAIRAVQEVLLVNSSQHHRHCPLEDLVLEGRDPDRSGLAPAPLRDVHAPDRRRPVGASLQAIEQRPEILIQVRRKRRR